MSNPARCPICGADAAKLRYLANWCDARHRWTGETDNEIQRDLRQWARDAEAAHRSFERFLGSEAAKAAELKGPGQAGSREGG